MKTHQTLSPMLMEEAAMRSLDLIVSQAISQQYTMHPWLWVLEKTRFGQWLGTKIDEWFEL